MSGLEHPIYGKIENIYEWVPHGNSSIDDLIPDGHWELIWRDDCGGYIP